MSDFYLIPRCLLLCGIQSWERTQESPYGRCQFRIKRIRIYPIKACAGTDVQEARIGKRGLCYDRRWLLVNEQGSDLHQFDYPRLASIVVSLTDESLLVQAPGMSPLPIPLQPPSSVPLAVQWFQGSCEAFPVSKQADAWFQAFLHVPCRLVFMPETAQHPVEPGYEVDHDLAAFTSFHYHMLGEGSLEDLNQRLETPVPLERFRPNLLIAGTPPFAEDSWRTMRMNEQLFHVVKPCDRCAITTVDPVKGVMTGKEPLQTLARYRTFEKKVLFGQYLLSGEEGILHVGDAVEVLEYQAPLIREASHVPYKHQQRTSLRAADHRRMAKATLGVRKEWLFED